MCYVMSRHLTGFELKTVTGTALPPTNPPPLSRNKTVAELVTASGIVGESIRLAESHSLIVRGIEE
jgi:hypothetical protein